MHDHIHICVFMYVSMCGWVGVGECGDGCICTQDTHTCTRVQVQQLLSHTAGGTIQPVAGGLVGMSRGGGLGSAHSLSTPLSQPFTQLAGGGGVIFPGQGAAVGGGSMQDLLKEHLRQRCVCVCVWEHALDTQHT